MKLALVLVIALSFGCVGFSGASDDEVDDDDDRVDVLMLNVYATNVSTKILDTIGSGSLQYLTVLLNAEPNYLGIAPGQVIPTDPDDRALSAAKAANSGTRLRSRGTAAAGAAATGGLTPEEEERSLLLMSCPLTCAKSSSTVCRQLGCAYCGAGCRRRRGRGRNLLLSSRQAALVEGAINLLLSPLCGRRKGCSIYAKIVRLLWNNGTMVEVPL